MANEFSVGLAPAPADSNGMARSEWVALATMVAALIIAPAVIYPSS